MQHGVSTGRMYLHIAHRRSSRKRDTREGAMGERKWLDLPKAVSEVWLLFRFHYLPSFSTFAFLPDFSVYAQHQVSLRMERTTQMVELMSENHSYGWTTDPSSKLAIFLVIVTFVVVCVWMCVWCVIRLPSIMIFKELSVVTAWMYCLISLQDLCTDSAVLLWPLQMQLKSSLYIFHDLSAAGRTSRKLTLVPKK